MPSIRSIHKFEYLAPASLKETLDILNTQKDTKVLAGGTDLLVQMKYGLCQPSLVIDVKNIPELNEINIGKNGLLHIGSAMPLSTMLAFNSFPKEFNMLLLSVNFPEDKCYHAFLNCYPNIRMKIRIIRFFLIFK